MHSVLDSLLPSSPVTESPPPVPVPAGDELAAFADALGEFMRAVRRARGRAAARQGELSLSQFHVLDALGAAGGPLPVSEVAVAAGIASPTATRMLGALEAEGLVRRARSEEDRRVVRVALTPAGSERLAAKRREVTAWRRRVFASLTPAEREQAARLLDRLAAAVEDLP